jgi:hypothetical protein
MCYFDKQSESQCVFPESWRITFGLCYCPIISDIFQQIISAIQNGEKRVLKDRISAIHLL